MLCRPAQLCARRRGQVMRLTLVFATLGMLAFASVGWAQPAANDGAAQVRGYLQSEARKHTDAGFVPDASVPDFATSLKLDSAVIWPVSLHRGVTYRVLAVCDN